MLCVLYKVAKKTNRSITLKLIQISCHFVYNGFDLGNTEKKQKGGNISEIDQNGSR